MEGEEGQKNEEPREQRSLDEFIAEEAIRMSPASWEQVRLVFVGAKDPESPLARLPMELIVLVVKLATELPAQCSGLRLLRRLRERAKQSNQGCSSIAFFYERIGTVKHGFMFKYEHQRMTPAGTRPCITVTSLYQRKPPRGVFTKSSHQGYWSEGTFLAMLTHHPQWRVWAREDEILKAPAAQA